MMHHGILCLFILLFSCMTLVSCSPATEQSFVEDEILQTETTTFCKETDIALLSFVEDFGLYEVDDPCAECVMGVLPAHSVTSHQAAS